MTTPASGTARILIAEDEVIIRELLAEIFNETGRYSVSCAADGAEALKSIRRVRPDIVVLDMMLPKLDGSEVCRKVKADPRTAQTKVLMLSGLVQESDRQLARAAGADAYMTKPFDSAELTTMVEKLLHG